MTRSLWTKAFSVVMLAVYLLGIAGFNVHSCKHDGVSVSFLASECSTGSHKCCCSKAACTSSSHQGTSISRTKCCSDESFVLDFAGSNSSDVSQTGMTPSMFVALHPAICAVTPVACVSSVIQDSSPPEIVQIPSRETLCVWRS